MSEERPILSLPDLEPMFAAELARRAELRAKEERDLVLAECASLGGFVKNAWHVLEPTQPYVHGWHIDAVCAHLEAVTDGWIRRLLINIPPGTMKSLLVSVFWPAWEWGPRGLPHMRYLTTSYEQELVLRDNLRMRRLVESDWYQGLWGETVRLAADQRAKGKFENTATGGREGRAFGSMTGGRGDRVLIDDPHSTKTAESETIREEVTTIFKEAVPTRLNNPDSSAIVIIMQRLHEKDVAGVALSLEQGYVHLRLPMEYEAETTKQSDGTETGGPCRTRIGPGRVWRDPRREEGELLFPERFSRPTVERDKRAMGAYAVAGQFQQRPGPRAGLLFNVDMIETVAMAPPMVKQVRSWDLAGTVKKQGAKKKSGNDPDWTAGVKIGKGHDGFYYIVHAQRWREQPGKTREQIKGVAGQDGPGVYITVPKDPAQAGVDQVNSYAIALAGYMLKARPPTGDKSVRAEPLASMVELGLVKMVKGPWNEDYRNELRAFPTGAHDDYVDASADAFNEIAGIVPGEGLLEFYRQEAERAALAQAGAGSDSLPPGGMVGLLPPAGLQMAFGQGGRMYRLNERGEMWVHPDDAPALERHAGMLRIAQDVAEA
jgi:predicted phage terminase large subunit-like protein